MVETSQLWTHACPPLPGLARHDVLVAMDGIEFGVACGFTAKTYTGFRC